MEILNQNQLVKELDRINQESFKYVGVLHVRSGFRPEVESHKNFIENLNAKPIREIKIKVLTPPKKNFINLTFNVYANIYNVDDVKDKLKGISKHKCMVTLKYEWGECK